MCLVEPMLRSTQIREHELLISVGGELDLHSLASLRAALESASDKRGEIVVIDLGEVSSIDSIALGALTRASRLLRESGGALAVVVSKRDILHDFEIAGLDRLIPIEATVEEAFERLRSQVWERASRLG